jgi:hypothetical protein
MEERTGARHSSAVLAGCGFKTSILLDFPFEAGTRMTVIFPLGAFFGSDGDGWYFSFWPRRISLTELMGSGCPPCSGTSSSRN